MLFIRAMLILKDGENKNLKSKYTPSKRKLIAKNMQSGLAGKKNTSPKKKYISYSVPN